MKPVNQFGASVRKLRESKDWSQENLAEAAKLHRTYISGVERGIRNPTLSVIIQIARALKVRPGALIDGVSDD
jgi:transcriptional regulator with XRE-family HTH domain